MLKMNLFIKSIFFTFCFFLATSSHTCEKYVETYVVETYLGEHFVNSCDGYGDCMDPAELIKKTKDYNTYKVFVYFGNDGGYPSDDEFVVTTNKFCKVVDLDEIN